MPLISLNLKNYARNFIDFFHMSDHAIPYLLIFTIIVWWRFYYLFFFLFKSIFDCILFILHLSVQLWSWCIDCKLEQSVEYQKSKTRRKKESVRSSIKCRALYTIVDKRLKIYKNFLWSVITDHLILMDLSDGYRESKKNLPSSVCYVIKKLRLDTKKMWKLHAINQST